MQGRDFPNIEDEMNWHGKALGDKAEGVLKHLRGLLQVCFRNNSISVF